MKVKIRKGDTVEIISGADKGHRGEVIKVDPKNRRVVVQGASVRKKHQREVQTQGRTMTPGIIELESPMDISNVMLVCPKCGEPARVGVHREDFEPIRVCKHCGEEID